MQLKYSIVLLIIIIFVNSCKYSQDKEAERIKYFCGAEKASQDNKLFFEQNNSEITFTNNNIQNSEEVYSGKYSVKLDSVHKFGMSIKIKNIQPDEKYKLSVVRYGNPKAYIIASSGKGLYEKIGDKYKETNKKGWVIIEKIIKTPYYLDKDELNVYLWNTTNETVFFDNLKIERLPKYIDYNFNQKALNIYIDETGMHKLEEIKKEAFKKGILETTDDSWVKATMFYGSEDYKIKLRFKGDWLDHLQGYKWSFRIKVKKNKAWKGMKTFSIQNPKSRFFLNEWFSHKIFKKEDILTTRYEFIPVFLNNNPLGIYAYEEHFEKQLVESKKRREGVIMKFSEDQFWSTYNIVGSIDSMPVFEASDITSFKLKKTLKNKNLKQQFLIAQNLMYEYKYNLKKANEIFDYKKLAKYYAIITLTKMNHALRWHNMRFYYNPVISKLEPIAYDGYVTDGFMKWGGNIFGNFNVDIIKETLIENYPNYYVFTDSVFRSEYVKQLERICTKDYIDKLYKEYDEQLLFYESEIQREFVDYKYDKMFLYNNAENIQSDLNNYKERINSGEFDTINFNKNKKSKYTNNFYEEIVPFFVNIYTENITDNNVKLKIENYLPFDIEIIGVSNKRKVIEKEIEKHIVPKKKNEFINVFLGKYKYLCFKIPKQNKLFNIEILKYPSPKSGTPQQYLFKRYKIKNNSKEIVFKKGNYVIDSTMIIPSGKKVIFEAGVIFDITNNSAFISYSPIFINGNKNSRVVIKSSDKTANGFIVLQANEKSKINYVNFENLNTLSFRGWSLTGAVNFYESDVDISNTTFNNNFCEDALNIVRSNFNVTNCNFYNIFSDAFDSDFCTGKLTKTNFNKIGNDAIDFSGSIVEISDCTIENVNDKGISGGENSTLDVKNCLVINAKIGFASKDKSIVTLKKCKVKNCKYGLVALQKKPEYDFAEIIATDFEWENVIELYAIEKKSKLNLNKTKIKGDIKNLAKRFY